MWLLLILVIHTDNVYTPETTIRVPVKTEKECKQSAKNITYKSKLHVINAVCKKL